jgi:hypothetical protein
MFGSAVSLLVRERLDYHSTYFRVDKYGCVVSRNQAKRLVTREGIEYWGEEGPMKFGPLIITEYMDHETTWAQTLADHTI